MKTTNYIRFAAAALAAIAALACSKAETAEPEAGNPEIPPKTPFTITAAFDDGADRTSDPSPQTRVSMEDDGVSRIALKWKTDDKIYVVNENSTTVYTFTVQSVSADGKSASFAAPDGYPESAPAYAVHRGTGTFSKLDPTSVSSKSGYALDTGLPNLFTLYAKYDAETKRLVFKPLMSVLKLNVTLPEAVSGRLFNIRIGAKDSSPIFYNSTYNITGETAVRSGSSMVTSLAFYSSGSISGGTATVYISMDPGTELAGKQLEITLVAGDYAYTATITAGTLDAGRCYPLTLPAGKWTAGGKMYEGGTGASKDDPYQIKNETNLRALAQATRAGWNHSGKYFRLENDISGIETSEAEPWLPISTFNGDFNGNAKTIAGTFHLADNDTYPGFFGYVSKPIYDLTLQGDVIYKGTANASAIYVGAIAGNCSSTSAALTGCKHIGAVSAENPNLTLGLYIGGIVGLNAANISGCVQTGGTVTANAPNSSVNAGGICGYFSYKLAAIHTSRNESNITVTDSSSGSYAGALVGRNSGTVYSCSTFLETLMISVNDTPQSPLKAIGYGNAVDESAHAD